MRAAPIRREIPARPVPAAPDQTTSRRPYHVRHPSGDLVRLFRQSRADHAVAGDQIHQTFFAPAFGAGGSHREHEISNFGGRIPDANLRAFGQFKAEIPEDATRIFHGLGPIGCGLVPDRRQPEYRPRITGAKRAYDHVVEVWGVLEHHDVLALTPRIAEFRYR